MADLLIAEIKKQMYLRGWSNGDLAKETGYKLSTINSFMANVSARNKSLAVGRAICKVLGIEDSNV